LVKPPRLRRSTSNCPNVVIDALERNLCVHWRHRLLDRGGSLRIGWPRAEKLYAGCDNLGALALAAVVLGLVLAYPQPAFNVDLASLRPFFKYSLQLSATLPRTTMLCQSTRS